MEEQLVPNQYESWNNLASTIALVACSLGVLIILIYRLRLSTTSGNKSKYDFISRYEVKYLFISALLILGGLLFYFNSNIKELNVLLIFMRIFLTVSGSVVIGLIIQSFLKFYYPFFIEKRLKALRYKPRISPKTGKPMKLLSEEEEDAYLDEGMQAEENVFSIDYDVWKDEESGFIQVEKYSGHLHALKCSECNYQTLKLIKEEIITEPTIASEGEITKHYMCSYCNHKAKKSVVLKRHPAA